MKQVFFTLFVFITLGLCAQNNPVAIDDTVHGMEQSMIEIYPLLNDFDPDGDTIMIRYLYDVGHGEIWFEDSTVYYKSEPGNGWVSAGYKAAEVDHWSIMSEKAYMRIELLENPDIPIAVKDSFHAKYLEPTILHPLHNDYDPNGDSIIIAHVEDWTSSSYCDVEISDDSTYVIVTSEYAPNGYAWFRYSIIEVNTSDEYSSHNVKAYVYLDENENLPIAANDTLTVTGGIPGELDVLLNDLNPSGDTLEFFDVSNPWNGELLIEETTITFTANTSYTGFTEFEYSIRYKNNPALYSQSALVSIFVEKNPDCPVGEPDYAEGMAYSYIPVLVLENDHDPNGDEFEIKDVALSYSTPTSSITFSGDSAIYRPQPGQVGPDSCFYRIMKTNEPEYYSEWIPIRYNIEWNPGYPKTFPDSANVLGGQDVIINFRSNDIIQDSIVITYYFSSGAMLGESSTLSDSTFLYKAYSRSAGRDTIQYIYRRIAPSLPGFRCLGEIYIDVENCHAYDSLNINNINAGFNASGYQFSRINDFPGTGIHEYKPHFEVPKGSGNHTMFSNALWVGGFDDDGQLHIAAERYRNNIPDFQVGPVNYGTYDTTYLRKWNRMWNISKSEINYHVNNWWKEGYEMPEPIENWPGNGEGLIAEQLAPYFDRDADGLYDPWAGDYPLIRGDQCLYFIVNDDKYHGLTMADSMLVEIHGMAYAFDAPGDSILNNAIFVHYDIINRSEYTYYDTYFGVYNDFSLGYAWDDYVGSHVSGNSYYAYSDEVDGNGGPGSYGDKPPAQSVTFLAGPFMDPDNTDNPTGQCDEGINGLNFGNGTIDDERHGMSYFIYFNGGGGPQGDPGIGIEYYNFMKALWKDETPLLFGGHGHFNSGGSGPACRYMWPGDSDPENWGTACVLPNDGYNQNGKWWTQMGEGNGYDAFGMASSGSFTFKPRDKQEVDLAYLFTNSYHSADSSVTLLGDRLLELRQRVLNGEIIIPNNELSIHDKGPNRITLNIYPNPARNMIYVQGYDKLPNAEYHIYNSMGGVLLSGSLSSEINISALKPGFYIITIKTEKGITSNKFIKH